MWSKTLLAVAAVALTPVNAVWPVPQDISTGDSVLFIDNTVAITYNGQSISYTSGYAPSTGSNFSSAQIVQGGVSRAFDSILTKNFVPWKLRERHSDFEPSVTGTTTSIKSIQITQTEKDAASVFKPLAGEVDESYSLKLTTDGKVTISAKSSTGVLHALETFSQLFFAHSCGTKWYTPYAPVAITDKPTYPHRGVLFDVARSWFDISDIERTIDAMAWNKMNRLHLHVTDSQSWPLEIPALPKLAEKGSYRKGLTYSPEDIKNIYEYGIARGVEVVMEIDMPGHIGVVELAYKDLIVAYNEKPYQWWCAEPPCGAFRLNSTDVFDFLDKLFADLFPRISPYTAYFHTGGDELNANDSRLDPGIKSNDTKVLTPLLQKFIDYTHGKVRKAGMTPLVWEEMVSEWNMTIGDDVIVQSWLGSGAVKTLAEAGHKVIDSDYNFWYLDCGRGQWLNFDNGESFQDFYPFADWCGPAKSWRLVYSHDPAAGVSEKYAKNVLGGEVAVWTETIDTTNLDSLLWPRGSAAGEVLWSGRTDASGQNRSQYDAAPRLAEFRERMVARGVGASPVQMPFCTQGNATECAMFYNAP